VTESSDLIDLLFFVFFISVVALGLGGGPVQNIWGALSYVEHAKIFWPIPCENIVTATYFVCINIVTILLLVLSKFNVYMQQRHIFSSNVAWIC